MTVDLYLLWDAYCLSTVAFHFLFKHWSLTLGRKLNIEVCMHSVSRFGMILILLYNIFTLSGLDKHNCASNVDLHQENIQVYDILTPLNPTFI